MLPVCLLLPSRAKNSTVRTKGKNMWKKAKGFTELFDVCGWAWGRERVYGVKYEFWSSGSILLLVLKLS